MATTENAPLRDAGNWLVSFLRSVLALFLGFVTVVVLSLGTDQVFHVLKVFPPWGEPMNATSDNLLALTYRCVYGVVGSYVTARFAPHSPMLHVWIGAGIGFVLSTLGIVAAINMNLGPIWYPVLLTQRPALRLAGRNAAPEIAWRESGGIGPNSLILSAESVNIKAQVRSRLLADKNVCPTSVSRLDRGSENG